MAEGAKKSTSSSNSGFEPKVAGLLSWLVGIIGSIIVIATEKKNKLSLQYAYEALIVHGGLVVIFIGKIILDVIIRLIPAVGVIWNMLSCLVTLGLVVAGLGVVIYGIIKALNEEETNLPMVSDWAKQLVNKQVK